MNSLSQRRRTVGVVGSGVAGSFAAHFLRKAFGQDLDVIVFERDGRVGGRVRSIEICGARFEAGGRLIHSANRYLAEAIRACGLNPSTSAQPNEQAGKKFGVWNGESFDFVIAPRSRDESAAWMMRRYGESLLRIEQMVRGAVERLGGIYDRQENGEAFASPEELFRTLGLYELTQVEAYAHFRERGVADPFVLEMSDGIGRSNYLQPGTTNAFVTLISLAGGGFGGGYLYSVAEGNARLLEKMIAASGARLLLQTPVRRIEADPSAGGVVGGPIARYAVVTEDGARYPCDAVVVATPLEFAEIEFRGVPLPEAARVKRADQTTHVTFVAGRVNPSYFRLGPGDDAPDLILTRENAAIPFAALGSVGTAGDGETTVYKLFSREEVKDSLLDALFAQRAETARLVWKAYPVLVPMKSWPPFRLGAGLYYVNAMESAVSTMETEAVAARNAVNLFRQEFEAAAR